jgi:hypothetical protein
MKQYRGRNEHGEWLVTIYPAEGDTPAVAAVTWRADEWETWSPEVKLSAVPIDRVSA